jgi:glycine cleavage system regulatory protein
MDITAVLTKVIQGQQRTIEDLQARLQRLERKEK